MYVTCKCLSTALTNINFHMDLPNTGTVKSMSQIQFTPNEDLIPSAFHIQGTVCKTTFNSIHKNWAGISILTAQLPQNSASWSLKSEDTGLSSGHWY